jgi:molybdopterin molybdotransferase
VVPLDAVDILSVDAVGCVLAADVVAGVSLPPFDNSSMDGYAVRVSDLVDVPARLSVVDDLPAGKLPVRAVLPGTAQRIMTGSVVPPEADAVVPVEWTDAGMDVVRIDRAVPTGANIRRAAEDVTEGEVVVRKGDRITMTRVALLSALGQSRVSVHRRPRVRVLSTGSELMVPGQPLRPGSIYESNATMITAAAIADNADPINLGHVADDLPSFLAVLDNVVPDADLIVTSGGISAGAYEVVKDALRDGCNSTVQFSSGKMRPGKPQGLGRYRGVPLCAVPGNPMGAYVSYVTFIRPILRAMQGHHVVDLPSMPARLTSAVRQRPDLHQYLRANHDMAAGTVTVVGRRPRLVVDLGQTNALIEIPAGDDELPAGASVAVIDLDR